LTSWLTNLNGIVCPNIRDSFTAGGQGELFWYGQNITNVPKIIIKMLNQIDQIKKYLFEYDKAELQNYWEIQNVNNVKEDWINLVFENLNGSPFREIVVEKLRLEINSSIS
jgi:hypothetical protein